MYVIDNSGRPKVMLEYADTARWRGFVDAETVSPIPLSASACCGPADRGAGADRVAKVGPGPRPRLKVTADRVTGQR